MFQIVYVCFLIIFDFNLCQCFDEAWYSYQNSFKNANREELVVRNLTAEKTFVLKSNVTKWKSLTIGPTCYSVGLMDTGLNILLSVLNQNKTGFDVDASEIDLKGTPSDVVLFHNRRNGHSEAILVISFSEIPQLVWMKLSPNKTASKFWTWALEYPIVHINTFKMMGRQVILIMNNEQQSPEAHLYGFDLKSVSPTYWYLQSLKLTTPSSSSAFNTFESDYFISIPQTSYNSVLIFKFVDSHFVLENTIKSPEVKAITSFEIGFQSFFAIDGYNAGIYEFSKDGLVERKIVNSHLEGIHYWLPVPVQSYRDEVILFAQRSLDHGTHETYVVEIITYNGGKFEEHEDVPCSLFEDETPWLTCLTHDNGIVGASYIAVGNKLGLIVPKPSSIILFMVHTAVMPMQNPKAGEIDLLYKSKDTLQQLIDEVNKAYEEVLNFKPKLARDMLDSAKKEKIIVGDSRLEEISKYRKEVEELGLEVKNAIGKINEIKEKENQTAFDTITVNGAMKIQGDFNVDRVEIEKINEHPVKELLGDIVRKDDIDRILKNKTFTDLEVEEIDVSIINGINTSQIVFIDGSEIFLNGNITFENPVTLNAASVTSGTINDVDLTKEAIDIGKNYDGALEFEEIRVVDRMQANKMNNLSLQPLNRTSTEEDNEGNIVFIPQNISVSFINGVNFTEFIRDLCLVNVKCYIPGNITIIGDVNIVETHSEYLNDLKFPEEFVLMDSESHATITGQKTFEASLTAREIRSQGTIDGVDTKNLVTLSTDQDIPDKLIFKNLELTEELNVTGNVLGEPASKFVSNPTLNETDFIKSNVVFRHLEVEGNITLENDFNGVNFVGTLEDLVYSDEEISNITGSKTFSKGLKVQGNLEIESNSINNVNLESFVTKDTEQILHINFLKGAVTIDNLLVNGTYDGVNITQLDESLVKLTGEQFISSTLIFTDHVDVENLEITGKLNELEASEYLFKNGVAELNQNVKFGEVAVENLIVRGNLVGNISGFDLSDLSKRYMSYTKDQVMDTHFHIENSVVNSLNTENVNGLKYDELFDQTKLLEAVEEMLNNDTNIVENLTVDGSIHLKTVNNKSTDEFLSINPLKTEDGSMKKELVFEDDVYFDELEINKLSSVEWESFVKEIVFKNETVLKLGGKKTFKSGIQVEKLIETEAINNVLLKDILTKEGSQDIKGPVIVRGNMTVEDVVVQEDINEIPIKEILDVLHISNGTYSYNGNMVFKRVVHIKDLIVNATVNNKIPEKIFQIVVYKNEDAVLNSEIIFKKHVNISGNFALHLLNNINVSNIESKIVFTTKNADIKGFVSFLKPTLIQKNLEIDNDLNTDLLFGFDTDEWLERAVYINRGLLKGHYSFDRIEVNEELLTDFINDIDMKKIVPLQSEQSIDHLEIEKASCVNDISVGNLVNGIKLSEAFENTVMANLDQEIQSDIIFENNILIRQHLTASTINGKNASKIVTTNTDQTLSSAFNFHSKCVAESDLEVHGLINGINFTTWRNDNIKLLSSEAQDVKQEWNVAKNLSFSDDVFGSSLIGGLDLPFLAKEVVERREYKYKFEKGIIDDYNNICTDVTYLYEKAKTQIYKFKYFDDFQHLTFQNDIKHVFYFKHKNYHYLLVNENNCLSHVLKFNGTVFHPLLENIETGLIEQVVAVYTEDNMFLVMRGVLGEQKCTTRGTNIWHFTGSDLKLAMTMEDQILLQESLIPGAFYAISEEGVIEYKMKQGFGGYKKYRKWDVSEANVAFVPRGLKTGLSLRTGSEIIFLDQSDPVVEEEEEVDDNVEVVIRGESRSIENHFIPEKNGSDLVVMTVGTKSARKTLLAVATHEETIVKARLDFVKIYGNALNGEVFDKVPTYKPSSLLSIEFNQGETLLVFMENTRILQVYEYKGIEGFKHRSSVKIRGSKLFHLTLPVDTYMNPRKTIGVIHKNKIRLIQAVMDGNSITDDLKCDL